MIFGEKQLFAVECEFTSQLERWVYGKFCVWVGGHRIGSYSEEVLDLKGTTGVLRGPVKAASSVVVSLSSQAFLDTVWNAVYVWNSKQSDVGYNDEDCRKWCPYIWFDSCEGFENVRSVIATDGGQHRIVWHILGESSAREQFVPSAVYEVVRSEFVSWLDRGLQERWKGIG